MQEMTFAKAYLASFVINYEVLMKKICYSEVQEDEWVNVRKNVRQRSLLSGSSECVAVLPSDLVLCIQEGKEQALNIVHDSPHEERIRANFVSTFKRHFHVNPKLANKENPMTHVVSRRLVPCGPNPLHN
nr:protein SAWADEE homeodomain homolog 2-like isoform X5 [Tanacetum cinerariifolium]